MYIIIIMISDLLLCISLPPREFDIFVVMCLFHPELLWWIDQKDIVCVVSQSGFLYAL